MTVLFIVLVIVNFVYCIVGTLLHGTTWREMSYANSTKITLYGIIWTYDDWVALLRILLIVIMLPFTFMLESLFFIGCWVSTLLRLYGRTDYEECTERWLWDEYYQYTRSVCVYLMKLCICFNPKLKFKSNSRLKALFDAYFEKISESRRYRISRYYGLPFERDDIILADRT